jgi:hypothetical protein
VNAEQQAGELISIREREREWLGVAMHACNTSYLGKEEKRMFFQGQYWAKSQQDLLSKTS